jgi:hypothetical protein
MKMDCSQAGAMLDELALDVLPGDRRAALLGHLESCPGCRHLLDELSETADALLLAGPVVAPPAGFEDRVLERIDAPRARIGARVGTRARAQTRFRLLAAAAAAAVLLGIGGVTGAHLGRSSGGEFQTVKLISTAGADIGDVSTYAGRPTWFFMRLEGPLPNGTYRCVLDVDDGRTVPIGSLWAADGHGGWGEHVSLDPRHVRAARLLDAAGVTVATARLR